MMQVIWSERAFVRRQAIEDYIFYSFGYDAYASYREEIETWKKNLLQNPFLGAVEPLLEGMQKEYRSFVIGHPTKCIYYVEDNLIVFVDWWDVRRSIRNLKLGLQ